MSLNFGMLAIAFALALSACERGRAATPGECQTACQRVASLRIAPKKGQIASKIHEADENVDRVEEEVAGHKARFDQDIAKNGIPLDPKLLQKMAPRARRELEKRHAWEIDQMRLQRELGLKGLDEALATARKQYEDARKQGAIEEEKATAEAMSGCMEPCLKRPASFAQCLNRTQALEDIDFCEKR